MLSVRDGDDAVAVDQVVGRRGPAGQLPDRHRHPLTVAASGRALLDPHAGAIVSEGELEPGVRGVAAAVVGTGGQPIASLAVGRPAHRFPADDDVAAARAAARRIGGRPGRGTRWRTSATREEDAVPYYRQRR